MHPTRVLSIWLPLAALAIANGALRVKILQPRAGDAAAHVMGRLRLRS